MGESDPPRRKSVHQALGGGSVSNVLLWKRPLRSFTVLVSATSLWLLFERGGYNILSFVANVLFLLVVILFLWAKSALVLNRPLPPLPDLEVTEESVANISNLLLEWINYALSIAHDITIGRNLKLFLQVTCCLLVISYIGSLFNFLTLLYIGVLLALSVPFLYDKYQDHIDDKLSVTHKIIQRQCRKIDDSILKKIPLPANKEKKIQ